MMAARATGPLLVRLAAGLMFLAGRDAATAAETPVLFPPLVVTTSAAGHDAFTMPQVTTLVTEDTLRDRQARTLPSALEELPGIMVQKTGTAQARRTCAASRDSAPCCWSTGSDSTTRSSATVRTSTGPPLIRSVWNGWRW